MRKLALLLAVLVLILTPACVRLPTPTVALPALEGAWSIQFVWSDGLMGMSRTLVIDSSGRLTANEASSGATADGSLAPAELVQLKQLVASTRYKTVLSQSGCMDCIDYQLQITGKGAPFATSLDQLQASDAGLDSLFAFLEQQITKLLGK